VVAAVHVRGRAGLAALAGAVSFGLSMGAVALLRAAAPPEAQPAFDLWPRSLLEAVLTGLAAPPVQMALRRLDLVLGEEEPDLIGS
jgi:hypothetical protein